MFFFLSLSLCFLLIGGAMPLLTNRLRFSEHGRSSTSHPLKNLHAFLTRTHRTSHTHLLSLTPYTHPTTSWFISPLSPAVHAINNIPTHLHTYSFHYPEFPCKWCPMHASRPIPHFFAACTASTRRLLLTSHHGGNMFWMPRDCRHCSSLHGAVDDGSFLRGWYLGGEASCEGDEVLGLRRSPAQACWWKAMSSQISGSWGEWMLWDCPWWKWIWA